MDKTYWRDFYSKHKIGVEPSLFARFVYENYLSKSIDSNTSFANEEMKFQRASSNQTPIVSKLDSSDTKSHSANTDSNQQSPIVIQNHTDSKDNTESRIPSFLELGCGNGRDSLYFANNGIDTTAIDQVQEEIEFLNDYVANLLEKDKLSKKDTNTTNAHKKAEFSSQSKAQSTHPKINPHFLCGDFTQLDDFNFQQQFDCIYSRFTLHSISKEQQDKTLADSLKYCKEGGILAIEVRGEKNSLCGKGKAVEGETNAFIYDNHYRRFLNFTQTLQEIESLRFSQNNAIQETINQKIDNTSNIHTVTMGGGGVYNAPTYCFKIFYAREDKGFAPFNGEDDYFIRIIARKERCKS